MNEEFDINPEALERNVCGCKVCQVHCAVMPSFLIPEDVVPYMHATGFFADASAGDEEEAVFSVDDLMPWAIANLLASDGTYVRVPDSDKVVQIPTLVPASRRNGSCVMFNQKSRLCAIHDEAPFGCRMFSCNMDEDRANGLSSFAAARLASMWDNISNKDTKDIGMVEGLYASIWLELDKSGHKRKRTTMALRKKSQKAIDKIRKEEE